MSGILELLGAAVVLVAAYLIHPGFALGIIGLYIFWLGRQLERP